MIKLISILILAPIFSLAASNPMLGYGGGLISTTVGVDSGSASSASGYLAGVWFFNPISDSLEGRIGAWYVQRSFQVTEAGTSTTCNLNNLEVPLTIGFSPAESFSLFGGLQASVNSGHSCSNNGKLTGVKGFDIGGTLGATIKIVSEFGIEIFAVSGGKVADGIKNSTVTGINLIYLIE